MNPEVIMLSEINQTKRTNSVCFHLQEVPRLVKFIETGSRMVTIPVAGGTGMRHVVFNNRCHFSFVRKKERFGDG